MGVQPVTVERAGGSGRPGGFPQKGTALNSCLLSNKEASGEENLILR